jgi:hypothetical protein
MLRLLVTANVVPSSSIIATLMMEARSSSEISVLTSATQPNTPEDDILHYQNTLSSNDLEHLSTSVFTLT